MAMVPTPPETPLIPASPVTPAVLPAAILMEYVLLAKLASVSTMAPVQYATAASTHQEESQLASTVMPTVSFVPT